MTDLTYNNILFQLNTDSLNSSTCCEVIELNAQVHAQLVKILSLVSDGKFPARVPITCIFVFMLLQNIS